MDCCVILNITIVPSKLRNDSFLGGSSVTVLSITKDIFVYLVITIRCKRVWKTASFSSTVKWVSNFIVQSDAYFWTLNQNYAPDWTIKLETI
jgi:hypothetical protein